MLCQLADIARASPQVRPIICVIRDRIDRLRHAGVVPHQIIAAAHRHTIAQDERVSACGQLETIAEEA